MINRGKEAHEVMSAAHVAQQPEQAPQAVVNAQAPVMWQAGDVRVPPVGGSPAGVLRIQQLKGNRAVSQRLAVQQSMRELKSETGAVAGPSHEKPKSSPNRTCMPDQLKSGIESLSGMSLDHVKVHYNSSQPAQLNALAYAQGTDIYMAPGQEQHLPHEAWHVIQQAQGRVKPTRQEKGTRINDDTILEREADVMGWRALHEFPAMPEQHQKSSRVRIIHSSQCCNDTVAQLKPSWTLMTTIKSLHGDKKTEMTKIEYHETAGIPVGDVKAQLAVTYQGLYTIELFYTGNSTTLDGKLKDNNYKITVDVIRYSGDKIIAVLREQKTEEEKEAAEAPQKRPDNIVKQGRLIDLIKTYSFKKIVTGNHIDSARKYTKEENPAVQKQQINEVDVLKRTLFIDPLFDLPGREGQYHDILMLRDRAVVSNRGEGLYIILTLEKFLGVLSKGVYWDEVNELKEKMNVEVSHWIEQKRPVNIIKE